PVQAVDLDRRADPRRVVERVDDDADEGGRHRHRGPGGRQDHVDIDAEDRVEVLGGGHHGTVSPQTGCAVWLFAACGLALSGPLQEELEGWVAGAESSKPRHGTLSRGFEDSAPATQTNP